MDFPISTDILDSIAGVISSIAAVITSIAVLKLAFKKAYHDDTRSEKRNRQLQEDIADLIESNKNLTSPVARSSSTKDTPLPSENGDCHDD